MMIFCSAIMAMAKYITIEIDENVVNDDNIQIIDIRSPVEWEYGVLKSAILVNLTDNNGNYNENFIDEIKNKIDPNKKIALICRSGHRSQRGSEILINFSKEV